MHLEYVEYLIAPDQIQSDCKDSTEVPIAQTTNSTKPPYFIHLDGFRFSFLLSQGLGLLPAAFSIIAASQTQLGSFSASFLGLFLVSKRKLQSSLRSILEGWCVLGEWQGVPQSSFCSQHPRKRQRRHTEKEKLSKDYFYAFLAVGAVWGVCPSPAAALFLLGCLWYLFCLIFQFIFTNFEQPGSKGSKLLGSSPVLHYSAVCFDKPWYKRLSTAERSQDPSSSM